MHGFGRVDCSPNKDRVIVLQGGRNLNRQAFSVYVETLVLLGNGGGTGQVQSMHCLGVDRKERGGGRGGADCPESSILL